MDSIFRQDEYQGPTPPLTPAQSEIAQLVDQITGLDEQAWNYEDREDYARASATRAKIRPLRARLDALTVRS